MHEQLGPQSVRIAKLVFVNTMTATSLFSLPQTEEKFTKLEVFFCGDAPTVILTLVKQMPKPKPSDSSNWYITIS